MIYSWIKVFLMILNTALIIWVVYVLKDILLYGHHIAQEPNTAILISEIVACVVLAVLSFIVSIIELRYVTRLMVITTRRAKK